MKTSSRTRRVSVVVLLVLGTAFTVLAALGVWAQRQVLETDEWVDTSTELLESEPIRTALAAYLVDQVFSSDDLQGRIEELLPPRLDPLAKPAAAALEEAARREAPRVLGSAVAVRAWREANRAAHQRLIDAIDGEQGPVTLKLSRLLQQIADQSGLPAGIADRLPPNLAELEVIPQEKVDKVRDAVKLFRTLAWVLVALSVLCFAGAVFLSDDRRRTLLSVGACALLAALLVLAGRRVGGNVVVDQLANNPNAEEPARDAWKIATSLLVNVGAGLAFFGVLVIAGAWFSGPGRRAAAMRGAVGPVLRDHAAAARVGLGVLLLLLVLWGPVPWTQKAIPVLVLLIAAFAWLEWIRADARAAQ